MTVSEPMPAVKISPTPIPMPAPAKAASTIVFHVKLERFSIRFDHLLVLLKALFLKPFPAACSVVIQINIHKTVTLGHFIRRAADDINRSPSTVSEHIDTIVQSFLDGFKMFPQLINPIIILHRSLYQLIQGSQSIFRNH